MDLISCMKTWPPMCSETAFIIFSPDLRIMSCMCSVHKVTLMDPEAAKKPAKISTLCDALMRLGNYFENDWAGPAHMTLWTPAPVLLPKNSSPELVPRSRGCCGRHTWGMLKHRFVGGLFWNWAVPQEVSQQGKILEKTSHLLMKKWAKLISRGINAVKKDVLSSSLSKYCIQLNLPLTQVHQSQGSYS